MVYAGIDRPGLQNSSVIPGPAGTAVVVPRTTSEIHRCKASVASARWPGPARKVGDVSA